MKSKRLFTPVVNLDVEYEFYIQEDESAFKKVKGNIVQRNLKEKHDNLKTKYLDTYRSTAAKNNMKASNIVTASFGVVYSDSIRDEGIIEKLKFKRFYIDVPYKPSEYLFSAADFFNTKTNFHSENTTKNSRNKGFNNMLQKNINNCKSDCAELHIEKNLIGKQRVDNIKALSNYSQFHETFHHSEQTLMYYLSAKEGLDFVEKKIMKMEPATICGVVLDFYSTRFVCMNCNIGLLGFQNSQRDGFMCDLTNRLEKKHVETIDTAIFMNTRVSANIECKGGDKLPLFDIKNKKLNKITDCDNATILQANFNKLNFADTPKKHTNNFSNAYFLSRNVPKGKLNL